MPSLQVSEIWIYPIKSLRGVRCEKASVMKKGLENDRRWMLIDEDGMFMTQRSMPQMALFQVSFENGKVSVLHRKNGSAHSFTAGHHEISAVKAQLWEDSVDVNEVSKETSAWFSDQLQMNCRLVYFPEENDRGVASDYAGPGEHVSLADGFPFLIIGQASLDDLNTRLPEPVSINRFRPNFVFIGGRPYEEDTWKNFSIGVNRFQGVKNCSRCTLTTVNPETGEKGVEPLRTLSAYRKRGSEVYFGQNALALDKGQIAEGDPITLIR